MIYGLEGLDGHDALGAPRRGRGRRRGWPALYAMYAAGYTAGPGLGYHVISSSSSRDLVLSTISKVLHGAAPVGAHVWLFAYTPGQHPMTGFVQCGYKRAPTGWVPTAQGACRDALAGDATATVGAGKDRTVLAAVGIGLTLIAAGYVMTRQEGRR